MRVGILGGTFDPPHVGHLIVAQDALSALSLAGVTFVPAAHPPHKRRSDLTPAPLRLAMLRAAVTGQTGFAVDAAEVERGGVSYTVDTLRSLQRQNPDRKLFLLMGADQYAEFATWRAPDEIRQLARVVVLSRAGERISPATPDVRFLPVTRIDVSATDIRRRVARGQPIRYLVPAPVEALIREHGLYREERPE